MVMERLDKAERLPENQDPVRQKAIDIIRRIIKEFGVVDPGPKIETSAINTPDTHTVEARLVVFPSLHKLVIAEPAPEIAERWEKKGFANFEFFELSAHQFKIDGDYPDWNIKPGSLFWDNIANGRISLGAAKLERVFIGIDITQRPNYDNGRQFYQNDPFADLLEQLRRQGKIKCPKALKHIPDTSRFGIMRDALTAYVLPEIANMLGEDQVRLPKAIEFNVIGNLFRPEWGDTNTSEFMQDKFGDRDCLVSGRSDHGGLALVDYRGSDVPSDRIAFRPVVVLPSDA